MGKPKPPIQNRFGNQLRRLRIEADLTQDELAKKAEMDRGYYQHIEAGRKNVTLETVERLAKALGVSLRRMMPLK